MIIHPVVSATPSHPEIRRATSECQYHPSEETLPRLLRRDALKEPVLSYWRPDEVSTGIIGPQQKKETDQNSRGKLNALHLQAVAQARSG
ncbi:MAG: hypothetical protein MZV63_53475 [Marinilabiliales bacterium]|nr:hypothetical protein [Marinilabiliales bacterium]